MINSDIPVPMENSSAVDLKNNYNIVNTKDSHGFFLLNNKKIPIKQAEFKKAIDEGKFVYGIYIDATQDLMGKNKTPSDMIKDIEDSSDILFTELKKDMTEEEFNEKGHFNIVLASILDTDFLAEVLEIPVNKITLLNHEHLKFFQLNIPTENIKTNDKEFHKPDINNSSDKNEKNPSGDMYCTEDKAYNLDKPGEKIKTGKSIRVDTGLAAKLMDLAGELVLSKNQLRPMMEQYAEENSSANSVMQNLDRVTSEIQEYIMLMRMQPLGKLLGRFRRIIRDTAKKLSKKIDYTVEGEDVELDRTIIEGLANPLIHLLRNCIDHGIESPEERIRVGKAETGVIHIKALHQGDHVYISIQDDGRGMDPEKIVSAAVKKGIITKEMASTMTDHEKIDLILKPGFSTSKKITDISGRGVGMDVVKTNIHQLRGRIEIQSVQKKGTSVEIIIPLTLAIVPVLIAGTGEYKFAIPQLNVSEIVFSGPGDMQNCVEKFGNSEVIRLRERLLPIIRLRNILNIDSLYTNPYTKKTCVERRAALADRRKPNSIFQKAERRAMRKDRRKNKWDGNYIIVLKMGLNRFGLCVETLFDNEEIVVKPLSDYITGCKWFSGSTILGDGQVIMILDVSGLAERANLKFEEINIKEKLKLPGNAEIKNTIARNRNAILFSNDRNEYFALPLNAVSRLEVLNPCDIIKADTHKFMNYRGRPLSLFYLDELFSSNRVNLTIPDTKKIYVIIPKGLSFSAGIIVTCIVETMEITGRLRKDKNTHTCVKGTILIENKLVQFLDSDKICKIMGTNSHNNTIDRFTMKNYD